METKHKRGKELYEHYTELVRNAEWKEIKQNKDLQYAHFIAFLPYNEDGFALESVYEILERAEIEGKRVCVRPRPKRKKSILPTIKIGDITLKFRKQNIDDYECDRPGILTLE